MEENFKFEIISPERIVFSDNVTMITLPSYEGDMSILKNHISIITFLRPGIIKVQKKKEILMIFLYKMERSNILMITWLSFQLLR